MNELEIKTVIKALKADKADLQNQISQIELILERYDAQLKRLGASQHSNGKHELFRSDPETNQLMPNAFPNFPHEEHVHDQMVFVMQSLGRAARKPDMEVEYKRLSGKDRKIGSVIRKMKDEGKLVSAKFNNSWTQTFYGLPDWIVLSGDKKVFDDRRKPSKQDLHAGLNTLQWLE